MDKRAFRIALEALKSVPSSRRRVILNGDILDFEFLHNKNVDFKHNLKSKNFEFFAEELEKEYLWYYQFEEALLEVVRDKSDISFIMGNHEDRVNRNNFLPHVPHSYRHWTDVRARLGFEDRIFIPYNEWLLVGDLHITHGMACGSNPLRTHYNKYMKKNLLIGHTHEVGIQSFSDAYGTINTYNNPCLCYTDPEYMERRPNNWDVGFTLVHEYQDKAHVQIYSLKDGIVVLSNGTVLK
jgi:hypothetical protein